MKEARGRDRSHGLDAKCGQGRSRVAQVSVQRAARHGKIDDTEGTAFHVYEVTKDDA